MVKDIDHFLDSFIAIILASIPIFLVAVSFWAQGFKLMIDGTLRIYYLTRPIMQGFVAQIALTLTSLVAGLWSRLIDDDAKLKKTLFTLSLVLYLISLLAFLIWVTGLFTFV